VVGLEELRRFVLESIARERVEVEDVMVTYALEDADIARLIMEVLRRAGRPVRWSELKVVFKDVCGEDRLRRILYGLVASGEIAVLTGTRYATPENVPPSEVSKVKNVNVLDRIYSRFLSSGQQ
jgi:hypothetical protein